MKNVNHRFASSSKTHRALIWASENEVNHVVRALCQNLKNKLVYIKLYCPKKLSKFSLGIYLVEEGDRFDIVKYTLCEFFVFINQNRYQF